VLGVVWYAYGQSDVTAVFGVDVLMDGLFVGWLCLDNVRGRLVWFERLAIDLTFLPTPLALACDEM
jgi:hypothetical protein